MGQTRTNHHHGAEHLLQVLSDAVPALLVYIDAERRYRFINERYEDWFALPRTEIVGRHAEVGLGGAVYAELRPHLDRALAGAGAADGAKLPHHGR